MGVLDHFEPDAVLLRRFCRVRSCVALVDKGQFHRLAGDLLDLFGQGRDLIAVTLIGRRYGQRQQVAERVDRDMHLRVSPLLPVPSSRV